MKKEKNYYPGKYRVGDLIVAIFDVIDKERVVGLIVDVQDRFLRYKDQLVKVRILECDKPEMNDKNCERTFACGFITEVLKRGPVPVQKMPDIYVKSYIVWKKGIWFAPLDELVYEIFKTSNETKEFIVNSLKLHKLFRESKYPGLIEDKNGFCYRVKSKTFKKWVWKNRFKIKEKNSTIRQSWKKMDEDFKDDYIGYMNEVMLDDPYELFDSPNIEGDMI